MFLFRFFRNANRTDNKKRDLLLTELDDLIRLTKKEYDILTRPIEDPPSPSSSSLFPSMSSTHDPTTKDNRITSTRTMANEKLESINWDNLFVDSSFVPSPALPSQTLPSPALLPAPAPSTSPFQQIVQSLESDLNKQANVSLNTLEKRRKRLLDIMEGETEELLRKEQEVVDKRRLSFRSSLLLPSPPQPLSSPSSVTSPSPPLENLYCSSFLTDISETATQVKMEKQNSEQKKGNQKKEEGTSLWNLLNTKVAS